jgi:hypothetical protein
MHACAYIRLATPQCAHAVVLVVLLAVWALGGHHVSARCVRACSMLGCWSRMLLLMTTTATAGVCD